MIRTIIIDDERPSLDKLDKLLKNSGLAEVAGRFISPSEALAFLKENKVDAVFLDIEMPDMDGIELSNHIIDIQEGVAIVFVTAYSQYAVEAFRQNALDYLMKPVSEARLGETLGKILEGKGMRLPLGEMNVRCFGRFSVRTGVEEVKFRTEKAEELLAFMIDRRRSFISRSEIIDSLWTDFDGDRALIHFNTTLHYLKKALLQYGIRIPFTFDRGGYKFDMEGLQCDYLKFSAFVEKDKIPVRENILAFEEMARLYLGEYLSGWEYEWAAIKRLQLEEQYIGLVLGMAEYYKRTGSCQKAAHWLKTGLLVEPLHRELNFSLVEVLLMSYEHALATKYYDTYRNGLMKKMGQEPDEAFRRLVIR